MSVVVARLATERLTQALTRCVRVIERGLCGVLLAGDTTDGTWRFLCEFIPSSALAV
jgi:hypothetical protein